MHRRRLIAGALAAAAAGLGAGALGLTSTAGAAPRATHSGAIAFHSVSENNAKPLDVVTGAITDHGTDRSAGKAYEKVVLSQGTFLVASAKLNKAFRVKVDQTACYGIGTAHATGLAISHGTGAYAGITGSIDVTATFVFTGVVSNGKCQNLQKRESASVSQFSGTGHVSY